MPYITTNNLTHIMAEMTDYCNAACPMCNRKWSDISLPKGKKVPWTADHIIPVNPLPGQKQGTNDISNIQPLCFSCNSKKGNRV